MNKKLLLIFSLTLYTGISLAQSNIYSSNPWYQTTDQGTTATDSSNIKTDNYSSSRDTSIQDIPGLIKEQQTINATYRNSEEKFIAKMGPPLTSSEVKKLVSELITLSNYKPSATKDKTQLQLVSEYSSIKNPPVNNTLTSFISTNRNDEVNLIGGGIIPTGIAPFSNIQQAPSSPSGTSSLDYTKQDSDQQQTQDSTTTEIEPSKPKYQYGY